MNKVKMIDDIARLAMDSDYCSPPLKRSDIVGLKRELYSMTLGQVTDQWRADVQHVESLDSIKV